MTVTLKLKHQPAEPLDDAGIRMLEDAVKLLDDYRLSLRLPLSVPSWCKWYAFCQKTAELGRAYPLPDDNIVRDGYTLISPLWMENIVYLWRERYPHWYQRLGIGRKH